MKRSNSFLERSVKALSRVLEHELAAERHVLRGGLPQRLDPRAKLAGFAFLLFATLSIERIPVLAGILFCLAGCVLLSGVPLWLVSKIWLGVLFFTGTAALPALFLTPGEVIGALPALHLGMSQQGINTALRLLLRAEAAGTLTALLVFTTPRDRLLKALRGFRVPVLVVTILGMTHRQMLLFLQIATDFFRARRCRLVGRLTTGQKRAMVAGTSGVLLGKSLWHGEQVFAAMQARGFRGEPRLLERFQMQRRDWMAVALAIVFSVLAFWLGMKP